MKNMFPSKSYFLSSANKGDCSYAQMFANISANYLHSRPPKRSTQLCNLRSQKHFYALRMAYLGLWYLLPSCVSPLGTLQELLFGFRSNRNQQLQTSGGPTTLPETNLIYRKNFEGFICCPADCTIF